MRARFLPVAAIVVLLTACSSAVRRELGEDREAFREALSNTAYRYVDSRIELVSLAHIGTLELGRERFFVIYVRQRITGMLAPRGVNHVVIMNGDLKVRRGFGHPMIPLRCEGDRLILSEPIELWSGDESEQAVVGDVLQFTLTSEGGLDFKLLTRGADAEASAARFDASGGGDFVAGADCAALDDPCAQAAAVAQGLDRLLAR